MAFIGLLISRNPVIIDIAIIIKINNRVLKFKVDRKIYESSLCCITSTVKFLLIFA